jgi:hypothetical protein
VGSYAEEPGTELLLEAAYWRGRMAYFEVIGPWSKPDRMQSRELTLRGQMGQMVIVFYFWHRSSAECCSPDITFS